MRRRLVWLVALAGLIMGLLVRGPAQAAPGPGSIQGDVPSSGIALSLLTESLTPEGVVTALATRGCVATVIAITQGGSFTLYVVGAPTFVNVGFPATLASGQAFVYRCSGEVPFVAPSPVASATPAPTVARDCIPSGTVRRVGTGSLARFQALRTAGTLRGQVIFVDYSDARGTAADEAAARDSAARVSTAMAELSAGRLGVQYEFVPTWIRLPLTRSAYWTAESTDEHPDYVAAVRPIVAAAAAYDFVVLFDTGNPRSGTSYAGLFEYDTRTRLAKPRVVTSSTQYGVWLHETLHLLGLPDLYDETASTAAQSARMAWMGSWDVMSFATSPALTAWQRWELGWLPDPSVLCLVAGGSEVDLTFASPASAGTQLAVVRTGVETAVAVELRRSALPQACTEGVLVYRVDASKASAEGPLRLLLGGLGTGATFPATCSVSFRTQTDSYRWDAPMDLGPGRGASLTDPASGIKVEVLAKSGDVWRVRVTPPPTTGVRPSYTPGALTLRLTGSRFEPNPYDGLEWMQYDVEMTSTKYSLGEVAILRSDGGAFRGSFGLPYGALISRGGPSTVSIWIPARRASGTYTARIAMPDGGFADVTINHVAR